MTTLFLLFAVVGDFTGVEFFVMGILGAFGTAIVQGIKKFSTTYPIEGLTALNITVAVSVVLALIGAFATGAFLDETGGFAWQSVANGAFVVFGVATLAYKYLLSKDAPEELPETPETPLT